jgi:hypothetical protein
MHQGVNVWNSVMLDLSLLELALLAAIYNLVMSGTSTFHFEAVYQAYRTFCMRSTADALEHASKSVALKGFEALYRQQLVHHVYIGGNILTECRPCRLGIPAAQIAEAVMLRQDCPALIKSWITTAVANK